MKYKTLILYAAAAAAFFAGAAVLNLRSRAKSAWLTAERFDGRRRLPGPEQSASPAKYAFLWYKTAASSFCRPQNRWCALARKKLGPAKENWKAELRAKKIKFEDWMIE